MANPGELYFGSQTRATSGSSGSANILPLRCLILCASPENYHVIPQLNKKTKRHTLNFLLFSSNCCDGEHDDTTKRFSKV